MNQFYRVQDVLKGVGQMEKIAPWRILTGLVCLITLLQAGATPTPGRGAGAASCAAGKRSTGIALLAVSATASAAWAVGQRPYTPYCTTPVQALCDSRVSHATWQHPAIPGVLVELAGHDGDDAQSYQERDVREALRRIAESRREDEL